MSTSLLCLLVLVFAFNCIKSAKQSQSRLLRSIPDETIAEKIIPMMDVDTTMQLSETSQHFYQMTHIQMNWFKEESAAHYQEAIRVMKLDVHHFKSQFPILAEGADTALHDTFRSKVWLVPEPISAAPAPFNENVRFL